MKSVDRNNRYGIMESADRPVAVYQIAPLPTWTVQFEITQDRGSLVAEHCNSKAGNQQHWDPFTSDGLHILDAVSI